MLTAPAEYKFAMLFVCEAGVDPLKVVSLCSYLSGSGAPTYRLSIELKHSLNVSAWLGSPVGDRVNKMDVIILLCVAFGGGAHAEAEVQIAREADTCQRTTLGHG